MHASSKPTQVKTSNPTITITNDPTDGEMIPPLPPPPPFEVGAVVDRFVDDDDDVVDL